MPPILRPYAALLQSGLGGFNSQAIDYVCGLTSKQVLAWYVASLAESKKHMDTAPDATTPTAEPDGRLTFGQFRTQFDAGQYADRDESWWREKYAAFEANRVASEQG